MFLKVIGMVAFAVLIYKVWSSAIDRDEEEEVHVLTKLTLGSMKQLQLAFIRMDGYAGINRHMQPFWVKLSIEAGFSMWQVSCDEEPAVCKDIYGKDGAVPNVGFASWEKGRFKIYQGVISMDGVIEWIARQVQNKYGGGGERNDGGSIGGHQDFFTKTEQLFKSGNIDMNSQEAAMMATFLSAKAYNEKDYVASAEYSKIASNENAPDDCGRIQEATLLKPYPISKDEAIDDYSNYHMHMDALLEPSKKIDLSWASKADADYVYMCANSAFSHSLFYQPDAASRLSKWIKLMRKTFPDLNYIAPHLRGPISPSCRKGRIKVGVASAFWNPGSSVQSDFGGVFERLSRDKFEFVLIDFKESNGTPNVPFQMYGMFDQSIVIKKVPGKPWLADARKKIGDMKLDLLLYLDLTMSRSLTYLAMARLARVQSNTHGHPMTSGIDNSVMDFFVSWGAAELEHDEAKYHYTERLALLPSHSMHQYYEPRIDPNTGLSKQTGQGYKHFTRQDFNVEVGGTWYLCMQKPFKRQPEFDNMLANILKKDPKAHLLLHSEPREDEIFFSRLKILGADKSRIHFIPEQPHHKLMALYALSDVILDSYPAGGCTTTRESLEVGGMVVTLPARYLGSRWTLAYYSIMGVLDLVAKDENEYVETAVRLGTDLNYREKVRFKIQNNMHKLWRQTDAVDEWSKMLERMARFDRNNHDEL